MAFKMKGNPYKMGKMGTKSAMNMGKKSPMKAEGDPDPEVNINNLLSGLTDYGSGSSRDIALQKARDKAKKDYQNKTRFADDKNKYDRQGNVSSEGVSAEQRHSEMNEEAEEYEWLGAQDAVDNISANRANLRKNSTSGDREGADEWARQAGAGREATALQMKGKTSGFKMKGNPMQRNFGVGKSPMKVGDPKKQTSTSATTNLLGGLEDYEANKAAKDRRDSPDTTYYVGDLVGGEAAAAGGDAPASTKKEVAKRKAKGKAKQDRRRAQSTESYLANKAKMDAAAARRKAKKA